MRAPDPKRLLPHSDLLLCKHHVPRLGRNEKNRATKTDAKARETGGETARRETREERKNARTVRKRARWRADSWQTLPGVSARKDESVSSFLHKAAVGGGSDFFRREIGSGS